MRNQTAGIVRVRQSLFYLILIAAVMEIVIEFEDINHGLIATHRIKYNTITPPFLAIIRYCERIKSEYPDVMFYYIKC